MRGLLAAGAFAAFLWSPGALAFCRQTTCDPRQERCPVDAKTHCNLTGVPIVWASSCITVNVQRDGAPKQGISLEATEASVQRAIDTWLGADCGGNGPSLQIVLGEPVSCSVPEYESDHHNANVVMFREDEWPYEGGEDALGVTWLSFDTEKTPGELWDADIELNAVAEPLVAGAPAKDEVDLDSLIMHEMGHLLGMAHSLDVDATMISGYVTGSTDLRSLGSDDFNGICAIYPSGRTTSSASCEPRHGFSGLCAANQPSFVEPTTEPAPPSNGSSSCALAPDQSPTGGLWLGALTAFTLARRAGRRR